MSGHGLGNSALEGRIDTWFAYLQCKQWPGSPGLHGSPLVWMTAVSTKKSTYSRRIDIWVQEVIQSSSHTEAYADVLLLPGYCPGLNWEYAICRSLSMTERPYEIVVTERQCNALMSSIVGRIPGHFPKCIRCHWSVWCVATPGNSHLTTEAGSRLPPDEPCFWTGAGGRHRGGRSVEDGPIAYLYLDIRFGRAHSFFVDNGKTAVCTCCSACHFRHSLLEIRTARFVKILTPGHLRSTDQVRWPNIK